MPSQDKWNMASVNCETHEPIAHTTTMTKGDWLRERQQQMARQLAANADVRRRWIEADTIEFSSVDRQMAALQFPDNGSSKFPLKLVIGARKQRARKSLAAITSFFWHRRVATIMKSSTTSSV